MPSRKLQPPTQKLMSLNIIPNTSVLPCLPDKCPHQTNSVSLSVRVFIGERSRQAHADPRSLVYKHPLPQVLSSLKRLVSLSLSGNPILAETAHFRKTVITASPKLRYGTYAETSNDYGYISLTCCRSTKKRYGDACMRRYPVSVALLVWTNGQRCHFGTPVPLSLLAASNPNPRVSQLRLTPPRTCRSLKTRADKKRCLGTLTGRCSKRREWLRRLGPSAALRQRGRRARGK